MNNREEIEEMAREYADNNSCHTNDVKFHDFYGFVNGFESCRNEVAQIIRDNPNDMALGRAIRTLFLEKNVLYDDTERTGH